MSGPLLRALPLELRVLFACARSVGVESELAGPLSGHLDWGRLLGYADRERATPAVWNALSGLPDYQPPPESAPLQNLAMITEFRMYHLEQCLYRALKRLDGLGIETLLLKGAALGLTHYSSFADRPMVDLDLLVKPTDARRAWLTMKEEGWTWEGTQPLEAVYDHTHHHLPPLLEPAGTGTALEVHTGLHPRGAPILMPAERVWERSHTIDADGVTARVPCLVDQVIHLSTHFAWSHTLNSAGWRTFRDLDRLLRRDTLHADDFIDEARRARATSSCYWTLRLARTLVGVPVSDDLLDALRPPGVKMIGGMLERAYTLSLLPDPELACPSVKVQYAAWVAGMRPRWSGHGGMRPWDFSDLFTNGAPTLAIPAKVAQQWRLLPTWRRFLAQVLRPS